jgi:hypothetical protein
MKMTWHGGPSSDTDNLPLPEGDVAFRGAPPIGGTSLAGAREELRQIIGEISG